MGDQRDVLAEIADERARQDEKWGEQNHPDVWVPPAHGRLGPRLTGQWVAATYGIPTAEEAQRMCDGAAGRNATTWTHIAVEELAEAVDAAATDPKRLRAELVQVAAVAVAWIEAIDRRREARDG